MKPIIIAAFRPKRATCARFVVNRALVCILVCFPAYFGALMMKTSKKQIIPSRLSPPPAPPRGKLTVLHLVSQLEGQIARHTGYVPKQGVLMAPFVKKGQILEANDRRGFLRRCFRKKTSDSVTIALLNENEW
jgi:hypothetical protein